MSVGFIEDKEQLEYINKKLSGDNILLGAAGTGKTNIAMSILVKAAQMDNVDNILFLSFNKTLISFCQKYDLEGLAQRTHLFGAPSISIMTFHSLFSQIFRDIFGRSPRIYNHEKAKSYFSKNLVKQAIRYCKARYQDETTEFDKSEQLFKAEIKFIEDRGFVEYNEYEQAIRVGQGNKLSKLSRKYYWAVYKEYLTLLRANEFDCDFDNAASVLLDLETKYDIPKYQFIIIDEAQDLSSTAIRSIRNLLSENGVFLYVGDNTQEIYGTRLSWKSLGLNIRNKIKRLENNYRNTVEIGSFANDILTSELWQGDAEEMLYPKNMVRHGILPILVDFENKHVQNYFLDNLVQQFEGETTCILAFHKSEAESIAQYLNDRNIKTVFLKAAEPMIEGTNCFTCTYHSTKGLDFDNVILTGFDSSFVDGIDYVSEDEEKLTLASKLFYVACTRAKKRLIISSCGEVSSIFPTESTYYQKRKPYELIQACTEAAAPSASSEEVIAALAKQILLKKIDLIKYFDQSVANAKTELDIQSPWMTTRVVDDLLMDKLSRLLDRKVIIKILYGIQDDKHTLQKNKETNKVVSLLRKNFGHNPNFRLKKGNSHGKKIICDMDYAISGSYNWLSYTGISDREEEGTIITDKDQISNIRKDYFDF